MSATTEQDDEHTAKVVGVTVAAAVGGFLFGFDSSVVNGAVAAIQGDFALSDVLIGFSVAVALLGCAVGAWFAGQLPHRSAARRSCWSAPCCSWPRPSAPAWPPVSSR